MAGPTVTAYGMGARGNLTWISTQRPKNYREQLMFLYPNGSAPLTALMSKLPSERVDDYNYNWYSKALPLQGGTTAGIYEDAALSDAYDAGDDYALGTVAHAKVALAVAKEIRPGHQVVIRDSAQPANDINAKVTAVTLNGASSVITFRLLEADGSTRMDTDMADADTILIIGNINPQGGTIPTPISYQMTRLENNTQIFRTPLSIPRTARLTRLRGPDQYIELKREALELHGIEMEKAFLWGIPTEVVGDNQEAETTTGGIVHFIRTHASDNVFNFKTSTETGFSGYTWEQRGEKFLDEKLAVMFRYGSRERLAFCGEGALLGIQKIAKLAGQQTLTATQSVFGTNITTWVTPFGQIHLLTHPLFSYEATTRNRIIALSPENLRERFITQTHFKKDPGQNIAGQIAYDGTKEEFLTESGLEIWHPHTFADFDGIGLDNAN